MIIKSDFYFVPTNIYTSIAQTKWIKSYLLRNELFGLIIRFFVEKLITWTERNSSESQKFSVVKMIASSIEHHKCVACQHKGALDQWRELKHTHTNTRRTARSLARTHGFKRPQVMNKIIFYKLSMEASNFICQTNVEIELSFVIFWIAAIEKSSCTTHRHRANSLSAFAFPRMPNTIQ